MKKMRSTLSNKKIEPIGETIIKKSKNNWLNFFSAGEIENAIDESKKPIKKLTKAEMKKE